MGSFTTTYNKDYTRKIIKLEDRRQSPFEENPITLPYKPFLQLDSNQLQTENEEYATTFLETKVKPNRGVEKNHFQTPLDQEEIKNYLETNNCTTYTSSYSNDCKIALRKSRKLPKLQKLGKEFKIQSTTYLNAYREPNIINDNIYKRKIATATESNLGLNPKVLKLFKMSNNKSEYGDVISNLGGEIIKNQMYGKIIH